MSYLQYSLFYPEAEFLKEAGYGKVANVPCIFDANWSYARESSCYLLDRAKGHVDASFEWAVNSNVPPASLIIEFTKSFESSQFGRRPTSASIETIGRRHINFLEWCEWSRKYVLKGRGKPGEPAWKYVTYEDLIESYEAQMLNGTWGTHCLEPSTVNSRVDEACFFLHWAYQQGLRDQFYVPVQFYSRQRGGNRSDSHKPKLAVTRKKRVREKPINLRMPKPEEVERWLKCVDIEKGYTKGLMCRLIQASAIRRQECSQWRKLTLPEDKKKWRTSIGGRFVTLTISYGAKGEKYVDREGDYFGPSRSINIPIEMAEELHHYREFIRPKIRSKYINAAKTQEEKIRRMSEPDQRLFLSEYDGRAISDKVLYKAWTEVSYKPIDEWHPQLMRHYWVVTTLWEECRQAIAIIKQKADGTLITGDWITGIAQSAIETIIRPQLGHVRAETAKAYLVWTRQRFDASHQHDAWIDHLEISPNGIDD